MNRFYDILSKNSLFVFLSGLASLISLGVSIINDKFVLWAILSLCFFVLIILINLVRQNSKMLRRLDELNYHIFNQNVDLEYNEESEKYISESPITIVMTSFLTQEAASRKPTVTIEINYPSQLSVDYNFSNEYIIKEESNSNNTKFKVFLKSEAIIITIRSLSLSKERESEFLQSSKKINITFESELFSETKLESLPVFLG
ncbi:MULTISPECIES: hypothetical protein [Paenibacillus]|uniref:hypothetical protein n=1 Tax=Paenibacillus TaxID=44249 RepID=UPI00096C32E7|nr:hypothetical protein [Paenibacillus odorifer]OME34918.1 hypothetical protein BSK58_24750 [Paenibacillus odorifer]